MKENKDNTDIKGLRDLNKTVAIMYIAAKGTGLYEDVKLANIKFAKMLVDFLDKGGKLEEVFKKE